MDHSPPSLIRSPASSRASNYSRSPSLGLEYPASELDDTFYKADLYDTFAMMSASSNDQLDATTSAEWVEPTGIHTVALGMTPEYVYANYGPSMHAHYSHDPYSAQLVHAPPLPPYVPSSPLASMPSRSPDPNASSRHQAAFPSTSSMPRIKLESSHDYGSSAEPSQYPSPQSTHALVTEPSSYNSRAGSVGYLTDAAAATGTWGSKSGFAGVEESVSASASASASTASSTSSSSSISSYFYGGAHRNSNSSISSSNGDTRRATVARLRRTARRMTSKEDANHRCEVEGCGKLFSRSYNYKAHMETHDKKREYPFACTFKDCDKRFVRKTDLQRHHQSVHMKEKNHKCDYCGRLFARKDTLRRHMEDGCSRRFDITTLDLRGAESFDIFAAGRTVPSSSLPSSMSSLVVPSSAHLLPRMSLPRDENMMFMRR